MSRNSEAEIRKNMDRYIDGMKMNRGHLPSAIHLFDSDYRTLLKAENTKLKEQSPSAKPLSKVADYRGIPVNRVKTK
jgi:hypothetical protein